jgi:hypothetical protein
MTSGGRPDPEDRIYVDLQATPRGGTASLDTVGSRRDIERLGITLQEGLPLRLWCDDADDDGRPDPILVEGVAHWWKERSVWTAVIDDATLRHASDEK